MKRTFVACLALISFILISCGSPAEQSTEEPAVTRTQSGGMALVNFETPDFSGSGNCAMCHVSLNDSAGNDVSIGSHWRSTMMANAAKDPFWQAKMASEVARTPELKEVIEAKCSSCHMPMAYTQADTDGSPALLLGNGFLNTGNPLNPAAMDGVSCTVCHQIVDPVLGTYFIDTTTEPPDRLIYGPYENPEQTIMMNTSDFRPVFGEQIAGSVLCGTCH
ncbi:MAG: hypothetical protein JW954_01805 [Dehalococcoidaceae bacterium]|nr:hypothetical protein [Dehalococcoidaceae bacterium]